MFTAIRKDQTVMKRVHMIMLSVQKARNGFTTRSIVPGLPMYVLAQLVILCAATAMPPSQAAAAVHGDPELLRMVAMQHKANKKAILSWKGRAIIRDRSMATKGTGITTDHLETRSNVQFAYGRVEGAVRWNRQIIGGTWTRDGKESPAVVKKDYAAGLIRNGRYYRYAVPESEKNKPPHQLTIYKDSKSRGRMLNECFDPIYFLSDHGEDLTHRLMFLYEKAQSPKLAEWHVSRDGDVVTIETRWNKGKCVNRYVCDLSKGGNLVSYCGKDGSVDERWTYDFANVGGVWVLKSLTYNHTRLFEMGTKKQEKTIEWVENVVNQPFDPQEFSFAKMGVQPGDWVSDTLSDIRFKYQTTGRDNFSLPEHFDLMSSSAHTQAANLRTDEVVVGRTKQPGSINEAGAVPNETDHGHSYTSLAITVSLILVVGIAIVRVWISHRHHRQADR